MPTVSFPFRRVVRAPQPRTLLQSSDGDTPNIDQPIRMVSCDTPEKAHYAGGPEKAQEKLEVARQRLQSGWYPDLPPALADYLLQRLTGDAARRHIEAANAATAAFLRLQEERLARPDGKRRRVGVIPTGEIIDSYGRLLAYFAPYYANTAADPLPPRNDPRRRTFNLDMIRDGWAAFFPIYPSLPGDDDMNLAIAEAEAAWNAKRGAWALAGEGLLLGYEYRACIKLGTAKTPTAGRKAAFQRLCIDLRSLRNVGLFGFGKVPPPYRLWVWAGDAEKARADLGFTG